MRLFIDYLKNENLINRLVEFYKIKSFYKKKKDLIKNIIEKLRNINNYNEYSLLDNSLDISEANFDIIGKIYEEQLNHAEKKNLGEFYTPKSIVDYILNAVGYGYDKNLIDKKLIDISCGSGIFIIQAVKNLLLFFKKTLNISKSNELTIENARSIIDNIKKNIYGVDINPIACILCQINIHSVLFEIYNLIKKDDNKYQLPKFNILNINALKLKSFNKFDFVVGNPPYVFIRDIPQNQKEFIKNLDLHTNKGQYDYYQLFIDFGIKILKNHGYLGYIVPDSILALSNRDILRRYIYHTTKIKEIFHIGSEFNESVVSNVIIILKKESEKNKREDNNISIKIVSNQKSEEVLILQKKLEKWNYKFLINLNFRDIKILEKLNNNFVKLKELNIKDGYKISINRGVELNKDGEIIFCDHCQLFFPVPKKKLICSKCNSKLNSEKIERIIYNEVPDIRKRDFKRFIYSINRYQIKEIKYIDISKKGINYKNLNLYKKRIILRQMSQNNLICATYEDGLALTSQSFYNLKIIKTPIPEFNHFYLLGLINSQLLSFFFIKSFGSYKKLFPRILIEKIKNLPIKIPKTVKEKIIASEISDFVKEILENKNKSNERIKNIQEMIDLRVFEIYGLTKKEKEYISLFFTN